MKLLAMDPGAERAGIAVFDGKKLIHSEVIKFPRNNKKYQEYRLALEEFWAERSDYLYDQWGINQVVNEMLPPSGFNNSIQAYLVNCQLATVQAVAFSFNIPVAQVSARSVQSKIAIKGKTKKITKPQIKSGVISFFPEMKEKSKSWSKEGIWEESDAIAIGAYYLELYK